MLTPEETARRSRINRILLPIVALIVIAVVVVIVAVSCTSGADEQAAPEPHQTKIPNMTDDEYEQFVSNLDKIDPAIADQGTRNNARDTCSSLDSDRLIHNTTVRFSNADHDVTEDEAQQIVELIRDIGFCER